MNRAKITYWEFVLITILHRDLNLSINCAIIMQAYTFYQTFASAMTTFKQRGIDFSMQNLL
jgi:hypothetical protein